MNQLLVEVLESEEAKFAMFAAYIGRKISEQHIRIYASFHKKRSDSIRDEINRLAHKGILTSVANYYWKSEYLFRRELFIEMATYMLSQQQELIKEFEKMPIEREPDAITLWQIAEGYLNKSGSIGFEIEGFFPDGEAHEYLHLQLFHASTPHMVIGMSDYEFETYISTILADSLFQDSAGDRLYKKLQELIDDYSEYGYQAENKKLNYTADLLSCYRYFYDGTAAQAPHGKTPTYPYLVMKAIQALYAGNTEESVKLFTNAIKERNKTSKDKNLFGSPLMSYYLILAYKKNNTEEDIAKIEKINDKRLTIENHHLYPIKILAGHISAPVELAQQHQHDFMWMHTTSHYPLTQYLSGAIIAYFNLTPQPTTKPLYAILRHELSPYLNLSGEEKQQLTELYGGVPVLPTIKKLEQWEITLQDLEKLAATETTSTPATKETAPKEERIGYFMNYNGSYLEYRVQNRLKNGNWGAGKKPAQYDYFYGLLRCLDDTDKQIIASLNKRTYSDEIPSSAALPYLVGTDRVYTSRHAPYTQANIIEEKPYITVTQEDNVIKVNSNISRDDHNIISLTDKVAIRRINDTTFSVIRITPTQKQLAETLEKVKTMPTESYPTLLKLLPQLAKHIEIHSNMLEGGSSLEKIQGDASVHCTIDPKGTEYKIGYYIMPLQGGSLTYLSGRGDKTIYDQAGEKRYQINRDIKKEKENFGKVAEALEEITDTDFIDTEPIYLLPHQMLQFTEWAMAHSDICILEWPEGKQIKIHPAGEISVNITQKTNENWFAVEGEINLKDAESLNIYELLKLTARGNTIGNYVKIDETRFISLTEALRKQIQRLQSISQLMQNKIKVSSYNAGILAETIRGAQANVKTDNSIETLISKIKESETLEPAIPATLNATLRDYQYEGFLWITRLAHWGAGACLADDMGLGKTVQAITFLLDKAAEGPSLVVAPASVIMNWAKELARFAPTLKVHILNNTTERTETIKNAGTSDVVLGTYGLLPQEEVQLAQKEWNVICLDEAHTIKNRQTKISAAAMALNAKYKLILTGTPMQNHLGEMWNLLQFINPGLLGNFEQFSHKYITNAEPDLKSLRKIIQPFILRRTKSQVLEELPDKTEITRNIALTDLEIMAYEAMREEVEQALAGENKVSVNALAEITRLRQAACSLQLTDKKWKGPNSKLETLKELVTEITAEGNKVLIFSQFTSFLEIALKELQTIGIDYLYLNGTTPIKKREQMVNTFQQGQVQVFAISLKAGGLGLNLTQANYVIHLDPWWNPAIEQQATDRAHRIGQKQSVTVYHLIASNTIEEKILRLQKTKRHLSDALLAGTQTAHTLTIDELRQLVTE